MKTTNQKSFAYFIENQLTPTLTHQVLGGNSGGEEPPADIVIEDDIID